MGRRKKNEQPDMPMIDAGDIYASDSFSSYHKLPGDKSSHSHQYAVTVIASIGNSDKECVKLLSNKLNNIVSEMHERDLNIMFEENGVPYCNSPNLENISRYIGNIIMGWAITTLIGITRINVVLGEVRNNEMHRSVSMVLKNGTNL